MRVLGACVKNNAKKAPALFWLLVISFVSCSALAQDEPLDDEDINVYLEAYYEILDGLDLDAVFERSQSLANNFDANFSLSENPPLPSEKKLLAESMSEEMLAHLRETQSIYAKSKLLGDRFRADLDVLRSSDIAISNPIRFAHLSNRLSLVSGSALQVAANNHQIETRYQHLYRLLNFPVSPISEYRFIEEQYLSDLGAGRDYCLLDGIKLTSEPVTISNIDLPGLPSTVAGDIFVTYEPYIDSLTGRELVRTNIAWAGKFSLLKSEMRSWIKGQIPRDTCESRFSVGNGISESLVPLDGISLKARLELDIPIKYQYWWCGEIEFPCVKNWSFTTCTEDVKTKIFSADKDLNTKLQVGVSEKHLDVSMLSGIYSASNKFTFYSDRRDFEFDTSELLDFVSENYGVLERFDFKPSSADVFYSGTLDNEFILLVKYSLSSKRPASACYVNSLFEKNIREQSQ